MKPTYGISQTFGDSIVCCQNYEYGQQQTMNHIVDMFPLTKFEAGLHSVH